MIKSEFKKLLGNKPIVILILFLLAVNVFLTYSVLNNREIQPRSFFETVDRLVDEYAADPDATEKKITQAYEEAMRK